MVVAKQGDPHKQDVMSNVSHVLPNSYKHFCLQAWSHLNMTYFLCIVSALGGSHWALLWTVLLPSIWITNVYYCKVFFFISKCAKDVSRGKSQIEIHIIQYRPVTFEYHHANHTMVLFLFLITLPVIF